MKTINVKSSDQPKNSRLKFPFSTLELSIFFVVIAAILLAGFFILAPKRAIDEVADTRRRSDITRIYDAVTLFLIDQGGELPTYGGGTEVPKVETTNILTEGVSVEQLDSFVPKYLSTMPRDPDGSSYKIGVFANGRVAVAASLSIGETFIISESDPSVIQKALDARSNETEETDPGVLPGGTPTDDFSD